MGKGRPCRRDPHRGNAWGVILLCAAVDDELLPFRERLSGAEGVRFGAIGVGPVEAALGVSAAMEDRPSLAILVGTCGAFPGVDLRVGQAVLVERSILAASDVGLGRSYVPDPAQIVSHAEEGLASSLAETGLPRVGCVTVPAITRDLASAEALARASGMEVEHLEAHAFLRAAERRAIPAACVLGIANLVGPTAHEEWKQNAALASSAAAEALLPWLERLRR